MRVYRIVHTGIKTLLGGVYDGSGISLYHVLVPDATMGAPRVPPKMVVATHGMDDGRIEWRVVVGLV